MSSSIEISGSSFFSSLLCMSEEDSFYSRIDWPRLTILTLMGDLSRPYFSSIRCSYPSQLNLTPSIKSFCRYMSKFIARSCLWSLLWLDLTCSLRVYEDESLFPLWCQNSSSSIVSTNLLSICCFFSILKWLPVLQANFSSESALSLFARASGFLILKGTGGIFKFNF